VDGLTDGNNNQQLLNKLYQVVRKLIDRCIPTGSHAFSSFVHHIGDNDLRKDRSERLRFDPQ
jgi:hypothetical protein